MSRLIRLTLIAIAALLAAVPGAPGGRAAAESTPRLVVFEASLRLGGNPCELAGSAIETLAEDYAGQPVVFIEYPVANSLGWSRESRFWAASGSGTWYLPSIIVDSGHRYASGPVDYYNVYKTMVDAELARAPEAAIEALWWREGDKARFSVRVTNQSGTTLSTAANDASVHAIVYKDVQEGDLPVSITDRYALTAVSTGVATPLAPGASATFSLETADLTGVDWEQLHFLVVADYRPGGASGAYDMLQAAVALPVRENYDFWVNAGTGCTIDPPGTGIPPTVTVPYKGSITFSIAPNTGYDLVDVKVDNISQGAVPSFAFTNVDADHTISATCARKQFTITPTWNSGGAIAPGVMQTVLYGDSITFSITPDTGYLVDYVLVDGVSVGARGLHVRERDGKPHHLRLLQDKDLHDHGHGRPERRHRAVGCGDGELRRQPGVHHHAQHRLRRERCAGGRRLGGRDQDPHLRERHCQPHD